MAGATNTTLGTIKLAGDFIGGHAEAPTLRPSGVKADTYNITDKIYVDAQGRITWAKQLPEDFEWPEGSKTQDGVVQIGVLPEGNRSIDVDANSVISINKATTSDAGVAKLGNGLAKNVGSGATDIVVPDASTTVFGYARPDNSSMQVNIDGVISVDGTWVMDQEGPATTTTTGGVKVGEYFAIDGAGDLSVAVPDASTSVKGLMQIGTGLTHDGAVISVPHATSTVKGIFKPKSTNFFIDGDFNKLYLHNCASPYFGNPEGLVGLVAGVSGASMSIDWPTATISCSYNFSEFSTEASTSDRGKAQIGDNIDVSSGVISLPDPTDTIYGPVKVTGRSFKVSGDGALFWDTNYYASATNGGHVRPDGVTIKFSDAQNAVISHDPADTPVATTTSKGIVQVGSGFNVSSGVISVPEATASTPGVVSVGDGLSSTNGEITLDQNNATKTSFGISSVQWKIVSGVYYSDPDSGLTVDNATIELRTATTDDFGGVKLGSGLIDNGINTMCVPELATTTTAGTVMPDGSSLTMTNINVGGTIHNRLTLNNLIATSLTHGLVKPGIGMNISNNALNVNTATNSASGVVTTMPDSGLNISADGTISTAYATDITRGTVSISPGINVDAYGTVSVTNMPDYNRVNEFSGGQINIKQEINTVVTELNDLSAASIIYLDFGDLAQSALSIKLNFSNFMKCLTCFDNKMSIVYKVSKNTNTNLPVTITFTNQSDQSITPIIGSTASIGDLIVIDFVPSGKNIPIDGIYYFTAFGTTSYYFQDLYSTQYQVYAGHKVFTQ